jgi:hypothetical protein
MIGVHLRIKKINYQLCKNCICNLNLIINANYFDVLDFIRISVMFKFCNVVSILLIVYSKFVNYVVFM